MKASQIVEGVLFASDAPLKAEEIARADESLDEDRVEEAILELRTLYDETERAFQVVELGEGYQILTRPEFAPYLERFDTVPRPSRLSGPALETLAIIAYRQPIGRIEVEFIRGVGAAGVIRTLQDRDLVDVVGRGEGLGRPLLYGTTQRFLEHFGFASLDELPRPEDLPVVLRERAPLDELMEGEGGEEEDADPDQVELPLAGSEEGGLSGDDSQGDDSVEESQGGVEEDAAGETGETVPEDMGDEAENGSLEDPDDESGEEAVETSDEALERAPDDEEDPYV
ncbi:SMC-Scp complex subunit ScpB [Gemmatimonadota bacterium]